jgi:hypothetical protein
MELGPDHMTGEEADPGDPLVLSGDGTDSGSPELERIPAEPGEDRDQGVDDCRQVLRERRQRVAKVR